jgi:alcohol dehydrogenase class IV
MSGAPVGEFAFTRLEKVIFGPGAVTRLGEELKARGAERAVIVTGRTLGASPLLDRVVAAADGRCAGVFKGSAQHVPMATVRALTAELRRLDADAVVSFGGGSPIDTAKVAAASVMNGRDMTLEAGELDLGSAFQAKGQGGREIVHIAVPTTLSAGEYTPGGGATDEASRVKRATLDPRLQAKAIIHDPELSLATPDWLWVATGMRALDHAVEAAYSARRQPFVDAVAAKAIRLLTEHLPGSVRAGEAGRIAHRGQCQIAAWCSLFGGFNTGLGVSHAMGHQIGPAWDVPHGVTSCITLPHAMRFMARAAPERFEPICEGLRLPFDPSNPEWSALDCAERVDRFISGFDVPRSLKAVGVSHNELPKIAEAVHHEIELFGVIGRPMRLDEVQGLLEAAYEGAPSG